MKERGGVQSIERAFAIVEEVARHREGIRLGALSRRVGLHTSTAFHLVKTMLLLGYLRQMPDDKTYRLGTPLFRLAASCLDEVEMTAIAKSILEDPR
jgi:DNA-binding IclR family transcriptional regulator